MPSLASLPPTSAEQSSHKLSVQNRPMTTGTHSMNTLLPRNRSAPGAVSRAPLKYWRPPPLMPGLLTDWQNQWSSLGSRTTQWMERGVKWKDGRTRGRRMRPNLPRGYSSKCTRGEHISLLQISVKWMFHSHCLHQLIICVFSFLYKKHLKCKRCQSERTKTA